METQFGCNVRYRPVVKVSRVRLPFAFQRQAGHIGPAKIRREKQSVDQAIAGGVVQDERALDRATAEAFMVRLGVCFGGWFCWHKADGRLQAEVDASIVLVMIAAKAVCLAVVVVIVMLACV